MIRGADRSRQDGENAGQWMRTCSVTFEIIERLAAVLAAPQRLAGSRAEFGQYLGISRAALRTRYLLDPEQRAAGASRLRWRDAVFVQLAAAAVAHPVGGPGRRQHGAHLRMAKPLALQRHLDFQSDH